MKPQCGLTLVETLLGMTVAMFMLIYMAQMQNRAGEDIRAKNAAEITQAFVQMSAQYLVANRSAIQKAMEDGTDANKWCVIDADPITGTGGSVANNTVLHTCAIDVNWLIWNKVLPANSTITNPYNQKLVAVFRLIYADYDMNSATPHTTVGDVEMLALGTPNAGNERTVGASELGLMSDLMGGNGGFVPSGTWGDCLYDLVQKQACGTGGAWRAQLGDFLNTP